MNTTATVLIVVLVTVGAAVFPAAAVTDAVAGPDARSVGDGTPTAAQDAPNASNAPNDSIAAGERLSAAVGVGSAELEGDLSERAFGLRVARANGNASKAAVVADQLATVDQRLAELEERKTALEAARENGNISEGRYRAEMAQLTAETRTLERLANASERTAEGLPADVLEANGVDVEAIRTLKDDARNLTGPEVAEVARSIAGNDVGERIGGPPDDLPGEAGNRSDRGNGNDRGNSEDRGDGADRGNGDDRGNGGQGAGERPGGDRETTTTTTDGGTTTDDETTTTNDD